MPNWCNNILTFSETVSQHEKEQVISAILSKDENGQYSVDFNNLLPIPVTLLKNRSDRSLDWCCKHWGTKWNANTTYLDLDDMIIEFDTPWSPPIAWFEALCSKFKGVHFQLKYLELGDYYGGIIKSDDHGSCDYYFFDAEIHAFALEHFGWDLTEDDEV